MNIGKFLLHFLLPFSLFFHGMAKADETLGRLFFAPEKREILDRQRAMNMLQTQEITEDPQIVINGQVRRSSGKRTTWINGLPQNDGESLTGLVARPAPDGAGRVVIESGDDPKATVKIGDVLNRSTQETASPLGDGQIVVHKRGTGQSR